jgi:hypothetical protein
MISMRSALSVPKWNLPGKDQAEGLLAAVGQQDGVADDFAVEIDIGLGDGGDVAKFSGYGWHIGGSVGEGFGNQSQKMPNLGLQISGGWLVFPPLLHYGAGKA